jgi:glycosyltransferase involved in cell wall biosynthesis
MRGLVRPAAAAQHLARAEPGLRVVLVGIGGEAGERQEVRCRISEAAVAGVPVLASRMDDNVGLLGAGYPGYFPVGDTQALARLLWKDLPTIAYWLLPLAVGLPLIIRALVRHPLMRH